MQITKTPQSPPFQPYELRIFVTSQEEDNTLKWAMATLRRANVARYERFADDVLAVVNGGK